MPDKRIFDTLRDLINTCRDGEKGYKEAAEHVKDPALRDMLLRASIDRGRFAEEIENEWSGMGEKSLWHEGRETGFLQRSWREIQEQLGDGDIALLTWLEQGEAHAQQRCEEALRGSLPENIRLLVRHHCQLLSSSHEHVRMMRREKAA